MDIVFLYHFIYSFKITISIKDIIENFYTSLLPFRIMNNIVIYLYVCIKPYWLI